MNENIPALIKKVTESEELQAKFAALNSPEEAYELAKTLQEGFTKEEFLAAAKAFSDAADCDITDEDLVAAAGGDYVDYDDLPVSVKQYVDVMYSVGTSAIEVSKSISKSATAVADSAVAVSNSIADSAAAVSNSIAKSATEIYDSLSAVSDYSVEVSKSVSKVSKALAV